MIGDKLLIKPHHESSTRTIIDEIKTRMEPGVKYVITVGGESGCGKSETGTLVCRYLEELGHRCIMLSQDDYFTRPPQTNDAERKKDISLVGTQEVRLDLLQSNIDDFRSDRASISKPLVYFEDDRIDTETVKLQGVNVLVLEGTYTNVLEHVDFKIFLGMTYHQTKKARIERNRDVIDDYTARILEIEHKIIREHAKLADIVVNSDYTVEFKKRG